MQTSFDKFFRSPGTMAAFSLCAGLASLAAFFNPPAGLFMGASAILLALISRMYSGKFSGVSIAGIILGIFGILLSVILFFNFILLIRILDNPEGIVNQISDPSAAEQVRSLLTQYRSMLQNLR